MPPVKTVTPSFSRNSLKIQSGVRTPGHQKIISGRLNCPPRRTGLMLLARPSSPVSTRTPVMSAHPSATDNRPLPVPVNLSVATFFIHANDAVIIATHAGVCLIGRATRQQVMIGSRDVGVRSHDAMPAHLPDGQAPFFQKLPRHGRRPE